jgi:small basic protein
MFPLIGLIVGLLVGLLLDIDIPSAYSSYVAVGILAAIDSVVGAITANLRNTFNTRMFVTGFIGNSAIAVLLAALGDQLNLQLSLAAVFAFGNRIFLNSSSIRRMLMERFEQRRTGGPFNPTSLDPAAPGPASYGLQGQVPSGPSGPGAAQS